MWCELAFINIAKLRNMLTVSDAEKLVHAFMTSRLDYCNALLGGCPASSINKIHIVQNASKRTFFHSICPVDARLKRVDCQKVNAHLYTV